MSSTHVQPRRRGVKATSPQMTPLDTSSLFQKGNTFHSPPGGLSHLCDPIANAAFLPKRSSTSTENLEELLEDAGVRRVTNLIEQFDRTFSGGASTPGSESTILSDREVLPVPSFLLDHTSMNDDAMDVDVKKSYVDHHHGSDSGIGSSVDGSRYEEGSAHRTSTRRSVASSTSSAYSAVNRSFSALGSKNGTERSLGRRAIRIIEERIIKPILAEAALKDFHPLIADVPHRIGNKDISNLRDLEKTLIFLAPDYSASPESYQTFCERSVQCIHTTVEYLCERDQRLPTDRPYTNNYFLDLVEQIRRYAAIMAATRRKQENGEELDETDFSPEEKVTLQGGLSHNGRPVELVREKDGKTIPIAEDNKVDEAFVDHFNHTKRSLEEDSDMDDDEVRRSMARRRKSEKPGDVIHTCTACSKDFKRPCDLTKHLKTHSRPFKCPDTKCKFHEQGWPTEKERDRHVNDKHSAAPPQYKCLYQGCVYVSKRESNCKQHMEKTHGYVYVRSKSNGRSKKPSTSSNQAPNTPLTPLIRSPPSGTLDSSLNTPSEFEHSPLMPTINYGNFGNYTPAMSVQQDFDQTRRDSNTTAGTYQTGSTTYSPVENFGSISPDGGLLFANPSYGGFPTQQLTPALSTGFDFNNLNFDSSTSSTHINTIPHLSPGGQDLTLMEDEGFQDGMNVNFDEFAQPTGGDFTLFDTTAPSDLGTEWFDDLNNMGAHLGGFNQPDFDFDEHISKL